MSADVDSQELSVALEILEAIVHPADQFTFFFDFWLNPDAIAVLYDVPLLSQAHWQLLEAYLRDYGAGW